MYFLDTTTNNYEQIQLQIKSMQLTNRKTKINLTPLLDISQTTIAYKNKKEAVKNMSLIREYNRDTYHDKLHT